MAFWLAYTVLFACEVTDQSPSTLLKNGIVGVAMQKNSVWITNDKRQQGLDLWGRLIGN